MLKKLNKAKPRQEREKIAPAAVPKAERKKRLLTIGMRALNAILQSKKFCETQDTIQEEDEEEVTRTLICRLTPTYIPRADPPTHLLTFYLFICCQMFCRSNKHLTYLYLTPSLFSYYLALHCTPTSHQNPIPPHFICYHITSHHIIPYSRAGPRCGAVQNNRQRKKRRQAFKVPSRFSLQHR